MCVIVYVHNSCLCMYLCTSVDYNGRSSDICRANQLMTEQKHRCSDIVAAPIDQQMQREALC